MFNVTKEYKMYYGRTSTTSESGGKQLAVTASVQRSLYSLHLYGYENENLEKRETPDPEVSLAGLGGTSADWR
ncbi:hypothetical protein ACFX2F_018372 [Malus domestica]